MISAIINFRRHTHFFKERFSPNFQDSKNFIFAITALNWSTWVILLKISSELLYPKHAFWMFLLVRFYIESIYQGLLINKTNKTLQWNIKIPHSRSAFQLMHNVIFNSLFKTFFSCYASPATLSSHFIILTVTSTLLNVKDDICLSRLNVAQI